jgi:AraC family transcriptional regulator
MSGPHPLSSSPVQKAIWFIETHFAYNLTLEVVASAGGVSRHHMARAFAVGAGQPAMRYVRGRRLSEAARALSRGAPDILSVALEAGYGSHEAFTRAFSDQFGTTPEKVRGQGHVDNLKLVEPIKMDETIRNKLEEPRLETGRAMILAGLGERYDGQTSAGIPALWQKFAPHIGHVPGEVGDITYGVMCNPGAKGAFDYIAAVEVERADGLPKEFQAVKLKPQKYAVFSHRGHISTLRSTMNAIWNQWLPASGMTAVEAPDFERYGPEFNPRTGEGGVEVWLPVKA